MKPTVLLGSAQIPDTKTELKLYTHDGEFSIKIPGRGELMNTRVHGSEKALADLACERMGATKQPRVLVGGLGMGFTLAAALSRQSYRGIQSFVDVKHAHKNQGHDTMIEN